MCDPVSKVYANILHGFAALGRGWRCYVDGSVTDSRATLRTPPQASCRRARNEGSVLLLLCLFTFTFIVA